MNANSQHPSARLRTTFDEFYEHSYDAMHDARMRSRFALVHGTHVAARPRYAAWAVGAVAAACCLLGLGAWRYANATAAPLEARAVASNLAALSSALPPVLVESGSIDEPRIINEDPHIFERGHLDAVYIVENDGPARRRVKLRSGNVELETKPQDGVALAVDAGPFTIETKNAAFFVKWDPTVTKLEVHVRQGFVRVHQDGREVGVVREDQVGRGAESSWDVRTSKRKRLARTADDWRTMAQDGEYKAAYEKVRPRVFELAKQLGATDVLLLADTARLSGDKQTAIRVLETFRRRFAAHRQRATAAFTLGKLLESGSGDSGRTRALGWYLTAVRESKPGGTGIHREALGRLLRAEDQANRSSSLRKHAQTYLEHYPNGPQAKFARRALQD